MGSQSFCTFWHGPALSPFHWACLSSFAERGHQLTVYSYGDLPLPPNVLLADASRIISDRELFEFDGSFSAFSNIFRYRLLHEHGGWWVDTDVYCLTDDIPDCVYSWAHQDKTAINGAILKFPAGDQMLAGILDRAVTVGRNVAVWGEIGPDLLTEHLSDFHPTGHYGSTKACYPVHWLETHLFWMPDGSDLVRSRCAAAPFVHLWGSVFRHYGIDLAVSAPRHSFLSEIQEGTLPPLDFESQQRTLASIAAYLNQDWVRRASERLLGYDVSRAITT